MLKMRPLAVLILLLTPFINTNCSQGIGTATTAVLIEATGITGTTVFRITESNAQTSDLTFTSDETQQFFTTIENGNSYTLDIISTPEGSACNLSSYSGYSDTSDANSAADANVTITATCSTSIAALGGNISNLKEGDSLTLSLAGQEKTITENGPYTFEPLPVGVTYTVGIRTQPAAQFCTLNTTSGTVAGSNNSINASCTYTNKLFMHSNRNGNLEGRSGADALCQASSRATACSQSYAFLSVSSNDEIRDFESTKHLNPDLVVTAKNVATTTLSGTEIVIASHWDDLLDGDGLDQRMQFNGTHGPMWTGSNGDGSVTQNTCEAWTSTNSIGTVGIGYADSSPNYWINYPYYSTDINCDSNFYSLICMCQMDYIELSGSVTGLETGDTLVLAVNTDEATNTITADGTFSMWVAKDDTYSITVQSQPDMKECTVTNGAGTASSTVTGITVSCASAASNLYLFPTDSAVAANIGSRSAADVLCQTTQTDSYSDLECPTGVRAFITFDDDDEIRDMPTNYSVATTRPVYNASNSDTQVANDWADLLDGDIDSAFSFSWWSGSNASGANNIFNCTGWTVSDGSSATIGDNGSTDSFWIDDSGALCSQSYKLMCLCY